MSARPLLLLLAFAAAPACQSAPADDFLADPEVAIEIRERIEPTARPTDVVLTPRVRSGGGGLVIETDEVVVPAEPELIEARVAGAGGETAHGLAVEYQIEGEEKWRRIGPRPGERASRWLSASLLPKAESFEIWGTALDLGEGAAQPITSMEIEDGRVARIRYLVVPVRRAEAGDPPATLQLR